MKKIEKIGESKKIKETKKVGIVGSTGYAGQQLLWLLQKHPNVEIEFLSSYSYEGEEFSQIYGNYLEVVNIKCISTDEVIKKIDDIDLLFIALPHGMAGVFTESAIKKGKKVIDLGSDFRLDNLEDYNKWYGGLAEVFIGEKPIYGLSEINREKIKKSNLIANPGCYPTATLLALKPLLKHKIIETDSIIIDAKSGVSGAGRAKNIGALMCECSENIKAYGVASHRHTPEIEQEASKILGDDIMVTFTPHLVPMNRGILSVSYGKLNKKMSKEEIKELYLKEYDHENFVRVRDTPPETRWVKGSNYCDISVEVDERTGRVIVMSVIDNLMKGAAGQAVQNMNLMLGYEEGTALEAVAIFP